MDRQTRRQFLRRAAAAGVVIGGLPAVRTFDLPAYGWVGSPPIRSGGTTPTNDPVQAVGDPSDPPFASEQDGSAGSSALAVPTRAVSRAGNTSTDPRVLGADLRRTGAQSSLPFTGGDPRRAVALGVGGIVTGTAMTRGLQSHRRGPAVASEPRLGHPVDRIDGVLWRYETVARAAFGFTYRFRATDPAVGVFVEDLVRAFPRVPEHAHSWLSLRDRGSREPRFASYLDDDILLATSDQSLAIAAMLSAIDRAAVASIVGDRLVLHAAAATAPSGTVLLLGPSGAGKTTMTAALVRSGFGYIADEIVAFDHGETTPQPYHKAISLKGSSRWLFPDLRNALGTASDAGSSQLWHVPIDAIRSGARSEGAPITMIVELRYDAAAVTTLEPMAGRDALASIIANCFSGDRLDGESFSSASALAGAAPAYRLVFSDLVPACRLVHDTIASVGRAGTP